MRVAALVMAAGAGVRLGTDQPKAFHRLGDESLLERSCTALGAHPAVESIVLAVPAARLARVQVEMAARAVVVAGGSTRQDSVRLALVALAPEVDVVLVHDAARPFVPVDVIDRVLRAVDGGADAAIPALAVTDTIKRVGPDGTVVGTLNRTELRSVQTPQAFRRVALVDAHSYARLSGLRDVSDDAALVERHGGRVVVVEGAHSAFKITRPWDLLLAQAYLAGLA